MEKVLNNYAKLRSHFKVTFYLALPIIIGQLGQVLMGVVDMVMVGKVSKEAVSAVGVSNAVFFLLVIFGIGASTAIPALVSIALAKKDLKTTSGLLKGSFVVAIGFGLIIQVLILFARDQFHWMKQALDVEILAQSYLYIISFSVVPMLLFLCLKQFADGLSQTLPAMIITLAAVLLNVILNWIFIYGNLGAPKLGLDGAGIATLITRISMFLAIWLYIYKSKKIKPYIVELSDKTIIAVKQILQIGVPSGVQYFFEVAAFAVAAIIAGWIGINESASHQIAINLASITYMVATGISAAGAIRVGAAYGAKDYSLVVKAGTTALIMAVVFMFVCGIGFMTFRFALAELYVNTKEVIEITAGLLIIAALFQISDGIQCIALGLLRGLTDVKIPMFITLGAYWIVGMPLGYVLGFYTSLSVVGIWIGLSVGLTLSAVALTYRFYYLAWRKPKTS